MAATKPGSQQSAFGFDNRARMTHFGGGNFENEFTTFDRRPMRPMIRTRSARLDKRDDEYSGQQSLLTEQRHALTFSTKPLLGKPEVAWNR
jgi:hypothetical protein